ncbi:MAG TPA: response regulator [Steroidobacteraceae bacterium]|nr:response regulator [Steroidobacteraceae bacterium]
MSAGSAPPLDGARVLAVEDDFLVLLELATVLHKAGASTVRTCGTLEDALSCVESESFDAAVLDVRLGRSSVAPVAERLAQIGTPFVFYTGQVIEDAVIVQSSHTRIVPKPAPPHVLVTALVEAMTPAARPVREQ